MSCRSWTSARSPYSLCVPFNAWCESRQAKASSQDCQQSSVKLKLFRQLSSQFGKILDFLFLEFGMD